MEPITKMLEKIAFYIRLKIEEHMLIVMDKSTHEKQLTQPLQTNNTQFKIAVTFLTAYNGIFNVATSNIRFYFKKTITNEEDCIQINIPPGAYEIESLNNEIRKFIIDKGLYSGYEYPFMVKPNFSTLGSIVEIKPQGEVNGFVYDENNRNLLEFQETILYKEYNLSQKPVEILSFDSIFLECGISKRMIFKSKRSGLILSFTMDVDPGYK